MASKSKNKQRKMIIFDLDTIALRKIFKDYTIAYSKLKSSFLKRGFGHRQGSGYVSTKPISYFNTMAIIDEVVGENLWLENCTKNFDVTDVGITFGIVEEIKEYCRQHRDRTAEQTPPQNSTTSKAAQHDDEELERD